MLHKLFNVRLVLDLHMALMLQPDIISSLKYVWPEEGDKLICKKQVSNLPLNL